MHVEGDELVYDAVTCASCGAKIREDRPVCFRCGQRLVAAVVEPAGLPLATFASVVLCLALVGVGATMGEDPPVEAVRAIRGGHADVVASVDAREAADPIARAAHPQDAEALNNLAQGLVRSGRAEEAIAHFDKAIELADDRWAYHFNRARAYADLRDWPGAINGYRDALQLFPDDYATHFNLARALDAAARTAEAAAAYRRYLDLNPDEPSADKIRARIALLEGTASPRP